MNRRITTLNGQPRGRRWLWAAAAAAATAYAITRPRGQAFSFRGAVVVITGGARGLGLALARELAAERAHLVLLSRTRAELERVQPELEATAASVTIAVCDVRDAAAVAETIDKVARELGGIDVLINNAGVIQSMPFEHAQLTDFEDSLATHFWGALYCSRACLPYMRRQGHGRIVNIASIGGRIGVPHLAPYCAGKFALVGLSETMHAELKKDNIAVTTVTPHLMRTGSDRNVLVRGQRRREAQWFNLASATPLTSVSAVRAARQIIRAVRGRRATVTPGVQARAAQLLNAVAPETFASLVALVNSALPGPVPHGAVGERSLDIDLGWMEDVLPRANARALNQPEPSSSRALRTAD